MRSARQLLGLRRLREETLGANLFADPAWDLLLHLYVETAAGRQVAISGLCAAARVRPTTGLRWINLLADAGLLEKTGDPGDARRVFVGFAPGAEDRIHRLLTQAMAETAAEPPADDS
jgi:DNA-binding MarR family transcriptional regulator